MPCNFTITFTKLKLSGSLSFNIQMAQIDQFGLGYLLNFDLLNYYYFF